MRRGEVQGASQPIVGFDLECLMEDPGGLAGVVFRHSRRGMARKGKLSEEALSVVRSVAQVARPELVTWGPSEVIKSRLRAFFPGRVRVFEERSEVVSYIIAKPRMLFFVAGDDTLRRMVPALSATEMVDPAHPSEEFQQAVRLGRSRESGR